MSLSGYISLFSTCLVTRGARRSLITDTDRKKYFLVPHALPDVLQQLGSTPLEQLMDQFTPGEQEVIREYLDFLDAHELIFSCRSKEELAQFPELSSEWRHPAALTNAIVEVADEPQLHLFNRFRKDAFIPYIQYVLHLPVRDAAHLSDLIRVMAQGHQKGIQILFDNACGLSREALIDICNQAVIVELLVALNSGYEEQVTSSKTIISFTAQKAYDSRQCGLVGTRYLNLQLPHFTEAQQHNTCLNRKIAVDASGYIRNCPSMSRDFGHIGNTPLSAVLDNPEFTRYWFITKDQTRTCSDCEFRYNCTDCRAFLEDPEDLFSKPLKCGYDPYRCAWEPWSMHPAKQQAIRYYGLQEQPAT